MRIPEWVFLLLASAACTGRLIGPDTAEVQFETVTTGDSLDEDGYTLWLDNALQPYHLAPSGVQSVPLSMGDHHLEVADVAPQCLVRWGASRDWQVSWYSDHRVHLRVTCASTLSRLDDRILFETNRNGSWDIYAMRADGSGVVNVTNNGWNNVYPAVSPDGLRLAFFKMEELGGSCPGTGPTVCFSGASYTLHVMNADRTERRQLAAADALATVAQWSPDGKLILSAGPPCFDSGPTCAARLVVVNTDNGRLQALTTPETVRAPMRPAWSPDGTRIAFVATTDSALTVESPPLAQALYVTNPDGTGLTRLTDQPVMGAFAWSPDGTRLTFGAGRNYVELFVVNADGSGETQLTRQDTSPSLVSWCPDGTRVAILGWRGMSIINLDGAGDEELISTGNVGSLAWSPDGTRLVFEQGGQIFTINVDGSGLRNLTQDDSINRHPVWTRPPVR